MSPTQRTYTDIETGKRFRMYTNHDHDIFKLICDGEEVGRFFACAFDSVTVRLNTGREISLSSGQFCSLKDGELITHKRYAGFKKFTKI